MKKTLCRAECDLYLPGVKHDQAQPVNDSDELAKSLKLFIVEYIRYLDTITEFCLHYRFSTYLILHIHQASNHTISHCPRCSRSDARHLSVLCGNQLPLLQPVPSNPASPDSIYSVPDPFRDPSDAPTATSSLLALSYPSLTSVTRPPIITFRLSSLHSLAAFSLNISSLRYLRAILSATSAQSSPHPSSPSPATTSPSFSSCPPCLAPYPSPPPPLLITASALLARRTTA